MRNTRSSQIDREMKSEGEGWSDDEQMPYLVRDDDETCALRYCRNTHSVFSASPLAQLPNRTVPHVPSTSGPPAHTRVRAVLPRSAHNRTAVDFRHAPEVTLFHYYKHIYILKQYIHV